jgi:hypothetical protein
MRRAGRNVPLFEGSAGNISLPYHSRPGSPSATSIPTDRLAARARRPRRPAATRPVSRRSDVHRTPRVCQTKVICQETGPGRKVTPQGAPRRGPAASEASKRRKAAATHRASRCFRLPSRAWTRSRASGQLPTFRAIAITRERTTPQGPSASAATSRVSATRHESRRRVSSPSLAPGRLML